MRRRGHADHAAEPGDGVGNAGVVSRDDDGVNPACRGSTAIDVLDHRTAADVGERFAGKPGGGVTRGDDGDDGEWL
jgi:hypothetical protein